MFSNIIWAALRRGLTTLLSAQVILDSGHITRDPQERRQGRLGLCEGESAEHVTSVISCEQNVMESFHVRIVLVSFPAFSHLLISLCYFHLRNSGPWTI